MKKIKKALISVSNKKNLNFLIQTLKKHKIQIVSSGGTYKEIKKLGYNCLEISKYTNSKEIGESKGIDNYLKIIADESKVYLEDQYNEKE